MEEEKRVPLVVAFGVGFLFASFFFAYFDPEDNRGGHSEYRYHYGTVDHKTYDAGQRPDSSKKEAGGTSVIEKEDGLYALVNSEEILLSARAADGDIPTEGFYQKIASMSVSPEGSYIYYCEEQDKDSECLSYVYDVKNQGLYRVEIDDTTLSSDTTSLNAQWRYDGKLQINEYVSAQAIAPWLLAQTE